MVKLTSCSTWFYPPVNKNLSVQYTNFDMTLHLIDRDHKTKKIKFWQNKGMLHTSTGRRVSTLMRRLKTPSSRRFCRIAARMAVSSLVRRAVSSQVAPLGLPRRHSKGFPRTSSRRMTLSTLTGMERLWEGRGTGCSRKPKSRSRWIKPKSRLSMPLQGEGLLK